MIMLPKEKVFPDLLPHFPTRWQAVVFRNYGIVPAARIAEVLSVSEEQIHESAAQMGLSPLRGEADFCTEAYLTVLRANWHLLNYEQLMLLMDIDEQKLNAYLYEDDFCSVKLGDKPKLERVVYAPLTPEQRSRTLKIGQTVANYAKAYAEPPFAFRARFSRAPYENEGISVSYPDGCEDYVDFWRHYYELSYFQGKNIVCSIEKNEDWEEEDFTVARQGDTFFIVAAQNTGVLRGLQYLAENPHAKCGGDRHSCALKDRIIYSYFATCGDILLDGGDCCYPDGLLAELAKRKINGIWLHGMLRQLTPFAWDTAYSKGFKTRLQNLNALIARAKKYGIKVWLYLNEPRGMPLSFFDRYPYLLGSTEGEFGALCTSRQEVLDWLEESAKELFTRCPDLGGAITITMSENITNCFSRVHAAPFNCPRCKGRTPEDAAAQVNRILQTAIDKSPSKARLLVWTWGWADYLNWDENAIERGLSLLDEKSIVMCTSEDSLRVVKGNVQTKIVDYSISNVGPSEKTKRSFIWLSKHGRTAYAKVQVNNTWECAAVPFIPVFPLVEKHMRNLLALNTKGMLFSWTLGGYPSLTLDMTAEMMCDSHFSLRGWYQKNFKENAPAVYAAAEQFSRAFAEFPFSLDLLYQGPQNAGCANLMYAESTGLSSTMVCYPFDDIKSWRGPFSEKKLIFQFGRMAELWKEGVATLCGVTDKNAKKVALIAEVVYLHFYSSYLQMRFITLRDGEKCENRRAEMMDIVRAERENAARLLELQSQDSTVGYEASNQYFYYQNVLLEKIVNLDFLAEQL